MTALLDKLARQMKAIVGATIVALVSVAQWLVTSPDTAPAIESVIPAELAQFVPLLLGVAGTVVGYLAIYFKKNAQPATTATAAVPAAAAVEPPTDTIINQAITANSGEFLGEPAR